MEQTQRTHSLLLVTLFVMSTMTALVSLTPSVMATNETTSGVIVGTETWQGAHSLTGDVEIAPGAKLIIQPGTSITIPNGTYIHVKGNMCAGDTSCGAVGMGSNASRITFSWTSPANDSQTGRCYKMVNPSNGQPLWNPDASCFEGILIRDTIDIAQTKLNHVTIQNAYGLARYVADVGQIRFGALVLDGASPTITELATQNINTSSVLLLDLASPTFNGGTFTVGIEEREPTLLGNALQAYGAGSPTNPVTLNSPVFSGTQNGCSQSDNGRHVVWAQKSFVDIDHGVVASADYGYRYTDAAGTVTANTITTDCTGIDINGRRSVLANDYELRLVSNTITTGDNSPVTAYEGAYTYIGNNFLSGAAEGSGIQVVSSYPEIAEVTISNNIIGPVTGYNGIWGVGYVDVHADNNTFQDINREPVILGEYHFGDQGWQVSAPSISRGTFVDNTINNVNGSCESQKIWDSTFNCPAFHFFRSSATVKRNIINGVAGDGIRAIGAIIDVQDNVFNVGEEGARIIHHDAGLGTEYGTLAFFSGNTWNGVSRTYNITKSSVTVQSETIPNPPPGSNASYPILLDWPDAEAYEYNNWANQVLVAPTKALPPKGFPLSLDMTNNSTVLTYANLTNLDLSKVKIGASPIKWAVQLREAALVRFRTTVSGVRVGDAQVLLEDAHGNDIYELTTDPYGFTPWVSLPLDFHLDFTGNGPNPNGFAGDPGENSCNDGVDNDGDLLYDSDDPDCQQGAGTRELSKYFVTGYKFGKGHIQTSFNLTATYDDVLSMTNDAPTVTINQNDGHSFKRMVNFSGGAWDGNIGTGIFADDEQARWEQKGIVERIEVKTPDSSSWLDVRYATDTSNANGEVTYNNRPFRTWFFEFDMSDQPEGDYTFEFRAYDGVDHSAILTRTIRLNTQAPILYIDSPGNGTSHSDGFVAFTGRATNPYNGVYGNDIDKIHFQIDGPNFHTIASTTGGPVWSWDWNFSGMPRTRDIWTFKVWASDSSFCRGVIGECTPIELALDIDNTNAPPVISLAEPYHMQTITVSEETLIMGVARDTDGSVSRVEIKILDPQDALRELPNAPPYITNLADNGVWATTWDTSALIHDFHYLVQARSFDGHDYSQWVEVEVIINNPPDAGNNPPLFNDTGWVREIIIFCEEFSAALDRCGEGASITLPPFFSDLDGDDLVYEVYDNPDIIANSDLQHDILCADITSINSAGVATYDPVAMYFHNPDMDFWSCEGTQFIAKDGSSRAYSLTVDFIIRAVSFSAERVDGLDYLNEDEAALFSGTGRPGIEVIARSSTTGLRLNSTLVGDDGQWTLSIPESKFESGGNGVEFHYDGSPVDQSYTVQVGPPEEKGKFGWILWAILSLVAIALLGGVFFFFFVEFEEEDDDMLLDAAPEVEEDPYAWGRQDQQETVGAADPPTAAAATPAAATPAAATPAAAAPAAATPADAAAPAAAPQSAYPGWKWDAENNEWIPDPETQSPGQ
jgi:hypothetical protein